MFFSYFNFPTSDNISNLVGNFFWTNFIGLVPELYILHCFLRNEVAVLEFSYKTIIILYFLNIKKDSTYNKQH